MERRSPRVLRESGGAAPRAAQAWIEPVADDPEAMSALAVARKRLAAGRGLEALRRLRIFELRGALPDREALEELLHRSTQFYNPAKERCTVRIDPLDATPLAEGEIGLLVLECYGERRLSAERWWRLETGEDVVIREGVAWALEFVAGKPAEEPTRELATLRDREHGLLCNPHWQEARIAIGEVPLLWIGEGSPAGGRAAPESAAQAKNRRVRRPRTGEQLRGAPRAAAGVSRRRTKRIES